MIALITARSGSKSIPHKNIRLLGSKPLLCWSIETALDCGLEPYVSSDSPDYLALAERYGAKTLLRPASISQDNTPHIEVLEYEVRRIDPYPTEIALFQPTSPFRRKKDILEAIEVFREQDLDSLVTGVKIPDEWHPDEALQFVDGRFQMASGVPVRHRIRRRQDYRPSYVPSGSLYLFKTKNLAYGSFYGDRVGVYEVEKTVNINGPEDFERAEEIAKTWKA